MGGFGFGQGYFGQYTLEGEPPPPPSNISVTELAATYDPVTELAATYQTVTELSASN